MGNDIGTRISQERAKGTVDDYLRSLPGDDYEVVKTLAENNNHVAEILTDLPSRLDATQLIALVNKWEDISKSVGKPLRVYGWSYDEHVETYLNNLVGAKKTVWLTPLPYQLKEVMRNA